MRKIKYIIKRIKSMDYKQFFKTINYINNKTNINKVKLFFDIIYCGIKYQAGYQDYKLFEMYTMNKQQRSTIITRGINNEFVRSLNDKSKWYIFDDKIVFNTKFNNYLNRDWIKLKDNNLEEFKEFIKKHKEIIVKPVDGQCGKGIEKIKVTEKNYKEIHQQLLKEKRVLIEEVATQIKVINEIHPYSVNTLRIYTIKGNIVASFLRIGNKKNVVDNFNNEGLGAPIDINDGIIKYPAIDKHDHVYKKHPITNKEIVGLKIPKWNEIKKYIKEISEIVPEVGYVGWDLCLSDKGIMLIEGNHFPGHDIFQLPPHRTNNQGLLPIFKKVINEGEKNEITHSSRS